MPPEDAKILMASIIDAMQGKLPIEYGGVMLSPAAEPAEVSPRALAVLYDKLITRSDATSSSVRKASGTYYTPLDTVNELVSAVLGPLMVSGETVSVFDPAAGCGNFLSAASDIAAAHGIKATLYGDDTDQTAADICRLVNPGAEIHCGDALRDLPWKHRFDAVIGNPPYVFTRSGVLSAADKTFYASRYRCGRGRISLPALFLERGINLLQPGGRLGYVIPATLLRAADFQQLRRVMLETCVIEEIRLLGARVFPGVTGEVATIVLQREPREKVRRAADVGIINNGRSLILKQSELEQRPTFTITRESLKLDAMKNNSMPLGDLLKAACTGIQTWRKPKAEFVADEALDERYRPLVEGRDVGRYEIRPQQQFILYDPQLLNVAHDESIFCAPEKILVQRVTGGSRPLKAALDVSQLYSYNSLNTLIAEPSSVSNLRLLALLNSRIMSSYYVSTYTGGAGLTVNIALRNLRSLPVPLSLLEQPGVEPPCEEMLCAARNVDYEHLFPLPLPRPGAVIEWLAREMSRTGPSGPDFLLLDRLTDLLICRLFNINPEEFFSEFYVEPV